MEVGARFSNTRFKIIIFQYALHLKIRAVEGFVGLQKVT